MDIKELCIQEIALEGLDGITLPTLWLRLNNLELKLSFKITPKLQDFLWRFILQHESLEVLQIPEPRNEPEIFDRFLNSHGHGTRIASAPDELDTMVEVYSMYPVDSGTVRGCCSNYQERVDIRNEILRQSLDMASSLAIYGKQRIVVVASQYLREQFMLSDNLNALVLADLSHYCYCVLEKITRSRWQGVMMSHLQRLDFRNTSFHAAGKVLHKLGLITKAHYSYKGTGTNATVKSQVLVRLTKFDRPIPSLTSKLIKHFMEILQNATNQSMNLGELREKTGSRDKTFKSVYTALQKSGEITISRADPARPSRSVHQMIVAIGGTVTEQEDDDEDDSLAIVNENNPCSKPLVLERPLMNQAYDYIVDNQEKGVSNRDIQQFLRGPGKLDTRILMKTLIRRKMLDVVLCDQGRQRTKMHVPKKRISGSKRCKEFNNEKSKMQKLVLSTKRDKVEASKGHSNDTVAEKTNEVDTVQANESDKINITESVVKSEQNLVDLKKWDESLTARTMKRHNIILEHVNRDKVITGYRTLQKVIDSVEKEDGCKGTIDMKSVVRLVDKMESSGVLRHSQIDICHRDIKEAVHFIMSLDCTDEMLQSAVNQAKFVIVGREENRMARQAQKEEREMLNLRKKQEAEFEKQESSYKGKLLPKFKRLRALHQYLWYLAHEHPRSTSAGDAQSHAVESETQKLYHTGLSWKKHLPPVPIHMHGGLQWLQVGELAYIMPLSIVCQIHMIRDVTPELMEFLNHDEKCHTLICNLPPNVKFPILNKRKFMNSLGFCVEQLLFMGLLTMAKSKVRDAVCVPKESMMIHLHKKTTIVDTRSSRNNYMKVEDKPYPKLHFVLRSLEDVESFWIKLQAVCMETKLGSYQYQDEPVSQKNSHLGTTTVRNYVKANSWSMDEVNDDGHIPGDGLGAGGLDSSMFSYLYRNWNQAQGDPTDCEVDSENNMLQILSQKFDRKRPKPSDDHVSETKMKKVKFVDHKDDDKTIPKANTTKSKKPQKSAGNAKAKSGEKKSSESKQKSQEGGLEIVMESNVGRNERVKGGRGIKRKLSDATDEKSRPPSLPCKTFMVQQRRRKTRLQSGGIIQEGKERIKYHDKVDLEAIQTRTNNNGRLRVNFSKAEDALYLLCNITKSFLLQLYWKKPFQPRKQLIPWTVVRDYVHKVMPESRDKTSISIGRRTVAIMKNRETRILHDISVADIKSDENFVTEFCPPELNMEKDAARTQELYCRLVDQLQKRFKVQPGLYGGEIPDTIEKLLRMYTPRTIQCKPGVTEKRRRYFNDIVKDSDGIRKSVVENMIYGALAMTDSEFSIYQVYRTFEEYPEHIISDVFTRMRSSGDVTRKLHGARKVSYSMRMYRLTHSHKVSLRSSVPQILVDKVSQGLQGGMNFEIKTDGSPESVLIASHFWTKGMLEVNIEIPDQVVLPETCNKTTFENQFRSMLEGAEKDLLKGMKDIHGKGMDGSTVPPDSLIAAAACILKENADDKRVEVEENSNIALDKKVKITELMRLYRRHPSYTNWLMLIKPNRARKSESKFSALNFSTSSDCVVLTPCTLTVRNTRELISKLCEPFLFKEVPLLNQLLGCVHVDQKVSEATWVQSCSEKGDARAYSSKAIFDVIDGRSYFGVTESDLVKALPFDTATLKSTLMMLREKGVVFLVGIEDRCFVSYKHISPWLAKGFRFKDSDRSFHSEIMYEYNLFHSDDPGTRSSKKTEKESQGKHLESKYEEVQYLCRPWHNLCGEMSFANAKSIFLSVFMKIYSSPGITQETLCGSYSFQRICVIEILEALRDSGCIDERSVTYPGIQRIFGPPSPSKLVVYYEATDDGLMIVSQWNGLADKMISRLDKLD